jgi:hypothetical protein
MYDLMFLYKDFFQSLLCMLIFVMKYVTTNHYYVIIIRNTFEISPMIKLNRLYF